MSESWYNYDKQARVASALAMLKLEAGCADCGYNADPVALDFDHVRGTKVKSVNALRHSVSLDVVLDEVDKCDVVCANCHRIRTRGRRDDRVRTLVA